MRQKQPLGVAASLRSWLGELSLAQQSLRRQLLPQQQLGSEVSPLRRQIGDSVRPSLTPLIILRLLLRGEMRTVSSARQAPQLCWPSRHTLRGTSASAPPPPAGQQMRRPAITFTSERLRWGSRVAAVVLQAAAALAEGLARRVLAAGGQAVLVSLRQALVLWETLVQAALSARLQLWHRLIRSRTRSKRCCRHRCRQLALHFICPRRSSDGVCAAAMRLVLRPALVQLV